MIFPKNNHLKVSIYASSALGMWPFVFEENSIQRRLYDIFGKFVLYYFIIFTSTIMIQLFIMTSGQADEELEVRDIVSGLGVTLLYIITALRVWIIRTAKIKKLIGQIFATEEHILKGDDQDVIQIYKLHVRQSQVINLVFFYNILVGTLCYFINSKSANDIEPSDLSTNKTVTIKPLPMVTWFPYDWRKHYLMSFIIQMISGLIGGLYIMFADAFHFSMIIFPLGQIRILIHVLSNFSTYVLRIKNQLQCSREEASFVTLRECILKHMKVIRYIQDYNDSLKYIMLLDFLQSSLQLASISVQLFLLENTFINIFKYGQFTFCMVIRLTVYYWYANEIVVESLEISSAIYNCEWYDEPERVKSMMSLMILRGNKAFGLDIGPFATMTLSTFVGIIKTTYSYMMIMYR